MPKGGGPCGCVFMGSKTSYTILIYDANKATVCLCPVNVGFEYTLQANLYINFYDGEKENWSIRFSNPNDYRSFCLNISLIKFHDAIYGEDALLDASFADILSGDLSLPGSDKCNVGEIVSTELNVWKMSTNADDLPNGGLKVQPLLNNTNIEISVGSDEDEGEVVFGGLSDSIVGMTVGAERIVIISPALVEKSTVGQYPNGCWLFGTLKINGKVGIRNPEETIESPPPPPQTTSLTTNNNIQRDPQQKDQQRILQQEAQSTGRERSDSIKERMARMSSSASGGGMAHSLASALGQEVATVRRNSRSDSRDFEAMDNQANRPLQQQSLAAKQQQPASNNANSVALVVVEDNDNNNNNDSNNNNNNARRNSGRNYSKSINSEYNQNFSPQNTNGNNGNNYTSPMVHNNNHGNNTPSGSGYQMQLLQMSSASVERMVRDMEAKINKLLRLQEEGTSGNQVVSYNSKNGETKKGSELDANQLIENLSLYVKETEKLKTDSSKHVDKISDLQSKVADLLEKNQEYVTTIIDLREKRNETLKKLSEVSEGHLNHREELQALKEKVKLADEMEQNSAQAKEELDNMKNVHANLISDNEAIQADLRNQLSVKEEEIEALKLKVEKFEKMATPTTESPSPSATTEITEAGKSEVKDENKGNGSNSLKEKVIQLENLLKLEQEKIDGIKKEAEDKINSIKNEASTKMKEVVQKKTQKVMGHVYKQISNEFKDSKAVDGDVIMQKVKDIIKETTMKLFS